MPQADPSAGDVRTDDDGDNYASTIDTSANYRPADHIDHLIEHPFDDGGDYLYDPACHVLVRRDHVRSIVFDLVDVLDHIDQHKQHDINRSTG